MDIGEDGLATATWAGKMDLDEWLTEYTRSGGWAAWGAIMRIALLVEGKTETAFLPYYEERR